jgi:hypothetical protein
LEAAPRNACGFAHASLLRAANSKRTRRDAPNVGADERPRFQRQKRADVFILSPTTAPHARNPVGHSRDFNSSFNSFECPRRISGIAILPDSFERTRRISGLLGLQRRKSKLKLQLVELLLRRNARNLTVGRRLYTCPHSTQGPVQDVRPYLGAGLTAGHGWFGSVNNNFSMSTHFPPPPPSHPPLAPGYVPKPIVRLTLLHHRLPASSASPSLCPTGNVRK